MLFESMWSARMCREIFLLGEASIGSLKYGFANYNEALGSSEESVQYSIGRLHEQDLETEHQHAEAVQHGMHQDAWPYRMSLPIKQSQNHTHYRQGEKTETVFNVG